jgi:DHA2 family methylenomycin A resistance protein-like MFS transporter
VFAVNIPVGLVAWWLTRRTVAASHRPAGAPDRRGDPAGQLTAILALTALTAALIEAGPHGWASWPVAAGLAIAAAGTAAFIAAQRRARSPMLPLPLLRRPALSGGSVVGLLINLGFYGQLFAYSLYLQQVRGDSPLIAGLSLLPEAAAVPVAAVLSGRLTSHRGPRATMITGLTLGAAGLLGLIVTAHGTPYWLLVLPMLAAGSGMALTMPAATTAVMDAAPDSRAGTAAGLINTARQVGGALGVAVAGSLVSGRMGFVPGLHVALGVCGGAFLLGAVVTGITVDRRRAHHPPPAPDQPPGPSGPQPPRAPRVRRADRAVVVLVAERIKGQAPSRASGSRPADRGPAQRSAPGPAHLP